jgi:hypothetical protein
MIMERLNPSEQDNEAALLIAGKFASLSDDALALVSSD